MCSWHHRRQGWEQDDRENRDQLYLRRMEGHGNEGCGKVSQDMVQTALPWKSGTWRLVHFVLPTNCMALGKSSCASPFFFFFYPYNARVAADTFKISFLFQLSDRLILN